MDQYLENKNLNSVLENYFNNIETESIVNENAEIESLVESGMLVPIEEGVYYDVLNEKAKFSFAIKFKQDKSTKKLWRAAKDAEEFLNNNGDFTDSSAKKGWNIVFRVFQCIEEVGTITGLTGYALTLPTALAVGTAFGAVGGTIVIGFLLNAIIAYLVTRLINWGFRYGQNALAKSNAEKVIRRLQYMKKNTKDKKAQERLDEMIQKVENALKSNSKE